MALTLRVNIQGELGCGFLFSLFERDEIDGFSSPFYYLF